MSKAKRDSPDGYWPEEPVEPLSDIFQEALARWSGDLPRTLAEFRAVVMEIGLSALEEMDATGRKGRTGAASTREREMMARLISEFMDAEKPAMVAGCYDFTFGLGLGMGRTQTAIAAAHGVGKATISQRCRNIVETFDVPPARGMKSTAAVKVYQERELTRHEKKRKAHTPWTMADAFVAGLTTG